MQTPSVVLNIGADVAKDEIVMACSEGSFPVRKVANQRTVLLAFLNGLPVGSRIGVCTRANFLCCLIRNSARTVGGSNSPCGPIQFCPWVIILSRAALNSDSRFHSGYRSR